MDRARLETQLKQAEGVRHTAYRDTEGYWTGGVGHLLDQSKDWTGVIFDDATILGWLDSDINTATYDAHHLKEWEAVDTDARQNALVELVFNLGTAKWMRFAHCRLAMIAKDWKTAHDQLLDSLWAHQVGKERSERLANQLLTGEFTDEPA